VSGFKIVEANDVTCDSFYSSQGRSDSAFEDNNETLVDEILKKYPETGSLQMETFQLLHLARLSKGTIKAGACAIALAQRCSNAFLDNDSKHKLELMAGLGCLDMLIKEWKVDEKLLMNADHCVWIRK